MRKSKAKILMGTSNYWVFSRNGELMWRGIRFH